MYGSLLEYLNGLHAPLLHNMHYFVPETRFFEDLPFMSISYWNGVMYFFGIRKMCIFVLRGIKIIYRVLKMKIKKGTGYRMDNKI